MLLCLLEWMLRFPSMFSASRRVSTPCPLAALKPLPEEDTRYLIVSLPCRHLKASISYRGSCVSQAVSLMGA